MLKRSTPFQALAHARLGLQAGQAMAAMKAHKV